MTDQKKIEELCYLLGKVTAELRVTAFKIKSRYNDEEEARRIEYKVKEMEDSFRDLIYKH